MSRNKQISSRTITILVLLGDFMLSAATLGLCLLSILRNFLGGLPYLVALIGMYNVATGYIVGKFFDVRKAVKTAGGIEYAAAMGVRRDA